MRRKFTLWMATLLSASALAPIPGAQAIRYADDLIKDGAKVNQTGRVMPLTVPLDDGGRKLGDLLLQLDPDDNVLVSKTSLKERFGTELRPSVLSAIEPLPEMMPLDSVVKAGMNLKFDKQSLAMRTELGADQRQDSDISLAAKPPLGSSVIVKPAFVSGYSNLYADVAHLWGSNQDALRFTDNSALRIGNFVFENDMTLENNVDGSLCPTNAFCAYQHFGGVKRQGSRLVYDMLLSLDRLTVGDSHSAPVEFGRNNDILGITLEHSPLKLDPTAPLRATGGSTFRLERPSTVEVIINGATAQRLQLPAGNYNLRDLPLRAGANDITLQITDSAGITTTERYSQFSGSTLLAPGKWESSFSAGAPSYFKDGQIEYRQDRYLSSVFGRYGIASDLTVEGNAQADNNVRLAGAGFVMSTPIGIWSLFGTGSQATTGLGGAARLSWELQGKDNVDALRLSAEHHTTGFRTPGDFDPNLTGIIVPTFEYKDSFAANYSAQLPQQWQMSLSGRYDIADPRYYDFSPLAIRGNRYSTDLSLSHPVFEDATLTGSVGYGNDYTNRLFTAGNVLNTSDNNKGTLWAGLRLFWRPTTKTTVTAASDSLDRRSYVSGSYVSGSGIDSWNTNVTASDDRRAGVTNVSGGIGYTGQRAEVSLNHDTGFTTFAPNGTTFGLQQQRTSARVGTALVFADGRAAISSPVRSEGGFAILYPHESIEGLPILAGSRDYRLAHSDGFGPAVVTGLPAYSPTTIPIDVKDLPPGYSLGSGGFDLLPAYRSGYALQVGSGYSVTLFGIMLDRHGKPLTLTAGTASNGTKTVTLFTNQAGKFSADGLAPGTWTLRMSGEEGPVTYVINVPKETKGLYRAGELRP